MEYNAALEWSLAQTYTPNHFCTTGGRRTKACARVCVCLRLRQVCWCQNTHRKGEGERDAVEKCNNEADASQCVLNLVNPAHLEVKSHAVCIANTPFHSKMLFRRREIQPRELVSTDFHYHDRSEFCEMQFSQL